MCPRTYVFVPCSGSEKKGRWTAWCRCGRPSGSRRDPSRAGPAACSGARSPARLAAGGAPDPRCATRGRTGKKISLYCMPILKSKKKKRLYKNKIHRKDALRSSFSSPFHSLTTFFLVLLREGYRSSRTRISGSCSFRAARARRSLRTSSSWRALSFT